MSDSAVSEDQLRWFLNELGIRWQRVEEIIESR